jgi:V8-like Glu-specific endopeptidase
MFDHDVHLDVRFGFKLTSSVSALARGLPMRSASLIISALLFVSAPNVARAQAPFGVHHPLDDRIDVMDNTVSAEIKSNARAVVAIVSQENLTRFLGNSSKNIPDYFELTLQKHGERLFGVHGRSSRHKLCPTEKFVKEFSGGPHCTGVIVGEYLIATAGHCLEHIGDSKREPEELRVILDYFNKGTTPPKQLYKDAELIRVSRTAIIKSQSGGQNWGVIEVFDKFPADRIAKIATADTPDQTKIYAIGFPNGLPMKLSPNGEVKVSFKSSFQTDLALFHGNSGSPVFDYATHQLQGLVMGGPEDYVYDQRNDCATSVCPAVLQQSGNAPCGPSETVAFASKMPGWTPMFAPLPKPMP